MLAAGLNETLRLRIRFSYDGMGIGSSYSVS